MKRKRVIPIFDGHNDSLQTTFLEKRGKGISILDDSNKGQINLHNMREGGMIGGFFAIQTPPENLKEREDNFGFHIDNNGYYIDLPTKLDQMYAETFVNKALDYSLKIIEKSAGALKLVQNSADISTKLNNSISVLLHLEGAEAIKGDLSNLQSYYTKGVRSIGLFWSRKNIFGTGVQYKFPSTPDIGDGLTEQGRKLVKRCNEIGILIDLAHINKKGFWDVVGISTKPLVVTHTDIHAICPASRNITDKQIDAIAKSNGVIGINFEPITTNPEGLKLEQGKSLDFLFHDLAKTPINTIVEHIDYIVNRVGADHAALGADMDGAIMPQALKDASEYQNIVGAMFDHGYDLDIIEKICYKNWLRVLKETIG